jgi:hypothetical protein
MPCPYRWQTLEGGAFLEFFTNDPSYTGAGQTLYVQLQSEGSFTYNLSISVSAARCTVLREEPLPFPRAKRAPVCHLQSSVRTPPPAVHHDTVAAAVAGDGADPQHLPELARRGAVPARELV